MDNLVIVAVFTVVTAQNFDDSRYQEYCKTEIFQPNCKKDEVILLQQAKYGRMDIGRCVKSNYGHLGCNVDVLREADMMCSGRHHCSVTVPNKNFEKNSPCPEDLTTYLKISYICLKVSIPHIHGCPNDSHIILNQNVGYLSNIITSDTGYGAVTCPWIIQLQRGQRINITLYDFTGQEVNPTANAYQDIVCENEYALITEPDISGRKVRVCGGNPRYRRMYETRTHMVEVRFLTNNYNDGVPTNYFVLKYEAVGCRHLVEYPIYGWNRYSKHNPNLVRFGCEHSDNVWEFECINNEWVGEMQNCSEPPPPVPVTDPVVQPGIYHKLDDTDVEWGGVALRYEISVGVIIGLCLIIGAIVILVAMIILEWRKMRLSRHSRLPIRTSPDNASIKQEETETLKRNGNAEKIYSTRTISKVNTKEADITAHDDDFMKEMWPMAPPPELISNHSSSTNTRNSGSFNGYTDLRIDGAQNHIYESPTAQRREICRTYLESDSEIDGDNKNYYDDSTLKLES